MINTDYASYSSPSDLAMAFGIGLKLDLSVIGYLSIFPLASTAILGIFGLEKWLSVIVKSYTLITLSITSVIVLVDANLYTHWHSKFSANSLKYLNDPQVIAANLVWSDYLIFGLTLMALVGVSHYLFVRFFSSVFCTLRFKNKLWAIGFLGVASLVFLPIRGGFRIKPLSLGTNITASAVYFSQDIFPNDLATNPAWYFIRTLAKGNYPSQYRTFLDSAKAHQMVQDLYEVTDSTRSVLNTERPNIVLFICESFTADIIESLGGRPNVTPQFDQLTSEGILFTRFYATGERSEKGVPALLSGAPSVAETSVSDHLEKLNKLPHLYPDLEKAGYQTSFYYGGDISFGNLQAYLRHSDRLVSKSGFDLDQQVCKWGVPDKLVLERMFDDLQERDQSKPFISSVFTLNSHTPFDIPGKTWIAGSSQELMFMNSAKYTDHWIGDFVQKAKKTSWWDNTLFILTADHSTSYCAGARGMFEAESYRIPMLWFGGAVATKNIKNHQISSQTDLANTLLNQLNLPTHQYKFSKNMFNPNSKQFAFLSRAELFGFIQDSSYVVEHLKEEEIIPWYSYGQWEGMEGGRAYLQVVKEDLFSD